MKKHYVWLLLLTGCGGNDPTPADVTGTYQATMVVETLFSAPLPSFTNRATGELVVQPGATAEALTIIWGKDFLTARLSGNRFTLEPRSSSVDPSFVYRGTGQFTGNRIQFTWTAGDEKNPPYQKTTVDGVKR